ncbi:MAG: hypothetical protein AAF493_03020 [Pseudomonadota bacterium]
MFPNRSPNFDRTRACEGEQAPDEHWFGPEFLPIRGDFEDPERLYRAAYDVAATNQAHGLELRAASSLARLWQVQKTTDARDLLKSAIYFKTHLDTFLPSLRRPISRKRGRC